MELRNEPVDVDTDESHTSKPITVAPFSDPNGMVHLAAEHGDVIAVVPQEVDFEGTSLERYNDIFAVTTNPDALSGLITDTIKPDDPAYDRLLEAVFEHGLLAGVCSRQSVEDHAASEPTARAVEVDGSWYSVCPCEPGSQREPARAYSTWESLDDEHILVLGRDLARAYIESEDT